MTYPTAQLPSPCFWSHARWRAVRCLTPPARPTLRSTTLQAILRLLLEQGEQPRIKELAVLEEVLAKKTLLLKAALFEDTGRRLVVGVDVGDDLHQPEPFEGVPAQALHHGGHEAPAPIRLRQPVPNLGPMGLAGLEAVEAAAPDQGVVGAANRKVNRTALLLGGPGDQGEPFVGSGVGVRKGDTEGAVVDVPVVEMLDEGRLVRRAELGQMNLTVDDDFHGGTWGFRAFPFAWEDRRPSPGVR